MSTTLPLFRSFFSLVALHHHLCDFCTLLFDWFCIFLYFPCHCSGLISQLCATTTSAVEKFRAFITFSPLFFIHHASLFLLISEGWLPFFRVGTLPSVLSGTRPFHALFSHTTIAHSCPRSPPPLCGVTLILRVQYNLLTCQLDTPCFAGEHRHYKSTLLVRVLVLT